MLVNSRARQGWFDGVWTELAEVGLGIGAVNLGCWLIPGGWYPEQVAFATHTLLCLAMTIRHRAAIAYLIGVLSAVSYAVFIGLHTRYQQPLDLFNLLLVPVILFSSAVAMSDLLKAQRRRLELLSIRSEQSERQLKTVSRRYEKLLAVNAELEEQVTGQPTSLATVSEKMARLWQTKGQESAELLVELIAETMHTRTCALYIPQGAHFMLAAKRSEKDLPLASHLNMRDPVIRLAQNEGRVRTVRDLLEEEQVIGEQAAILAGPILDQDHQTLAMVVITDLPLLKFTPGTVRLFQAMLQMASGIFQQKQITPASRQTLSLDWMATPLPAMDTERTREEDTHE